MIERTALPIEDLTLDTVQSRERAWTGDETDRQLAESVAADGLLQDLIVRPLEDVELGIDEAGTNAEYAIVAGSRRYHAAMEAGYETVPCKIIHADDLEAAWTSLTENVDRRELSEQEIAQQLSLIYELVRPRDDPSVCPDCEMAVDGEQALRTHCQNTTCELPMTPGVDTDGAADAGSGPVDGRFATEYQALRYIAQRFLGRDDDSAISLVEGHLRTAELPPVLQSLFKSPDDRTARERTAMDNYGIDTQTTLGSGEGKSGTSREVIALQETFDNELETELINPTEAVLETVGSLRFDEMSEQELRRSLREFRHELTATLKETDTADHQDVFIETLDRCASDLRETYEEVEPTRPFKKVDVLGPDTQRHSRWHVQVMQERDVSGHGELVRKLYQERLEALANENGWH